MVSGTDLFLGMFNNLAIFIVLVAGYSFLHARLEETATLTRQGVLGLFFGLFAIGCMYVKIPAAPGVIVDQRNAIVVLSGVFGGPLSAVVCSVMAAAYRLYLGGSGVLAGAVGVGLAAASGIVIHRFRDQIDTLFKAFFSALMATVIILPGFLFVGDLQNGYDLMMAMALPYGSAIFLGILLVGLLLGHEEHRHSAVMDRLRAERALSRKADRRQREAGVITTIALSEKLVEGDVRGVASQVSRASCKAVDVDQVGVWLFEDNETRLVSLASYDVFEEKPASGAVLREHEDEFSIIKSVTYMEVYHSNKDPRKDGWVKHYLKPQGIASLLIAVIRPGGRNLGIMTFEHRNTLHNWEDDEIAFACQLADQMALAFSNRERKRAEEKLRDALLRQNEAVKAGKVGLWDWNLVTNKVVYSAEWKRQIGYEEDEIEDSFEEWKTRVHPDDLDSTLEKVNKSIKGGGREHQSEFRFRHRDGSYRWIMAQASIIQDDAGRPVRMMGSHVDITARKKAEAQWERLKAQMTNAVEIAHLGPWEYDVVSDTFTFNDHFYAIFGVAADEVGGYEMSSVEYAKRFVHPEDRYVVSEGIQKAIQTDDPNFKRQLEHRILYADGGIGRLFVQFFIVKDGHGGTVKTYGVNQDITDLRKMEERLQQAQKLESIGNLAGGIAHDFNNILFPIMGMSEMLLDDIPVGSPEYGNVQEIFKASKRGSDLVKQILAFSRQSENKKIPVRIQSIVKEIIKLSRSTIPSNVEIVQEVQGDCGMVMADPTQLHQIAMNLITNAYHSLDQAEKKIITIALSEIELKLGDAPTGGLEPGRYAMMSVSDTGHGIKPEILNKIFEPYFTTKEQGKGTGLGLAVVFGIVKTHKGDINVSSKLGRGTTFAVYLPLIEKTIEPASAKPVEEDQTGNERILVVDDEEAIARLEKQMLERLGYRVSMRVNSTEALAAFKAKPADFDLVLSDMTMPNMTGDQLAKEIISIRPDIPIIICTGFSEQLTEEKAAAMGIKGLLMKPIIKSDMARMVRNVLTNFPSNTS